MIINKNPQMQENVLDLLQELPPQLVSEGGGVGNLRKGGDGTVESILCNEAGSITYIE